MIELNNTINLKENIPNCTPHCKEFLDYISGYARPSEMTLAVVSVEDFKDADDFFARAYGKRTQYDYRKIAEDGYTFKKLTTQERNSRLEELYAINTSTDQRQGGKMNETYYEYPKPREEDTCPHHFVQIYGAFNLDGIWIGYIDMYFAGEWCCVKHILGHQKYLNACKRGSFMVNLWFCVVKDVMENHPEINYIQYHLMGVGNTGLDEWKKRVGLQEGKIVTL